MGAKRVAVVLLGLIGLALLAEPAFAADLSSLGIETANPLPAPVLAPGPDTDIKVRQEGRVGVYAHNWIHDENSPVDVSADILS